MGPKRSAARPEARIQCDNPLGSTKNGEEDGISLTEWRTPALKIVDSFLIGKSAVLEKGFILTGRQGIVRVRGRLASSDGNKTDHASGKRSEL